MSQKAVYRIYTENKNIKRIKYILNTRFDSYTIYNAVGIWKGKDEKTLVIEIIGSDMLEVYSVAESVRKINKQDAVLVTKSFVEGELIV